MTAARAGSCLRAHHMSPIEPHARNGHAGIQGSKSPTLVLTEETVRIGEKLATFGLISLQGFL
jgi:hypothetical protein